MVHRYYDPQTGQFLSVDPLIDRTGDSYGYAGDDPIDAIDANGLDIVSVHLPVPDPLHVADAIGSAVSHGVHDTYHAVQSHVVAPVARAAGAEYAAWHQGIGQKASFAVRHRGEIATGLAIAGCLIPETGVGLVACASYTAGAFTVRAEQRIQDQGFRASLGANVGDLLLTSSTFGLVAVPGAVGLGEAPSPLMQLLRASGQSWSYGTENQYWMARLALAGPDIADFVIDLLRDGSSRPATCPR